MLREICFPLGIFWLCKIDEVLTKVSDCIFKRRYFLNLERGPDLGRSRLVLTTNSSRDIAREKSKSQNSLRYQGIEVSQFLFNFKTKITLWFL